MPQRSSNLYIVTVCIVVVGYLALALGLAATKHPWHDEAWFANPAFNLATTGSMGTTVLEGTGTWLEGIDRRTYWIMPGYLVTQAAWFKVFGFGVLQTRASSAVWGMLALGSWFLIMQLLSGSRRVAIITIVLIGFDYWFLTVSSIGRMDMMNAALGFMSFAAYLHFRGRNLHIAVLLSQSLVVASGLTHPNGVIPFAGLLFLTLYLDFARLKWRHLVVAILPYIIGGLIWGAYVLQDFELFRQQFFGNISGLSGSVSQKSRWSGLTNPLTGLKMEIGVRYLNSFGLASHSTGVARLKVLILIIYLAGIGGALYSRKIRQHAGLRTLLWLGLVYFLVMTLYEGLKSDFYLVHSTPILAAILAVWLHQLWIDKVLPKSLIVVFIAGLCVLQISGLAYLIWRNDLRNDYQPVVAFLKANTNESSLVMGSAEYGFGLNFSKILIDDFRLGYFSGKKPDLIIVGNPYNSAFAAFQTTAPEVHKHIIHLLSDEYRVVYDDDQERVYIRR